MVWALRGRILHHALQVVEKPVSQNPVLFLTLLVKGELLGRGVAKNFPEPR